MGVYSFPAERRLRSQRDFQTLYRIGKRYRGKGFNILYAHKPEIDHAQWGIAVSRKYGKAHDRNQAKRWVREEIRRGAQSNLDSYWIVVEVLPTTRDLRADVFRNQLRDVIKDFQCWIAA